MKNSEEIIKYPKMNRLEKAIITEKLDGSNFSWKVNLKDNKLMFFSRNKEVKLDSKDDKFYHEFIELIEEINKKEPFGNNLIYYAEVLGQGHIKYYDDYKKIPAKDKLFLIDVLNNWIEEFISFEYLNTIAEKYNLNIVPLSNFNELDSKINKNVVREGLVLRYENFDKKFNLKLVERKSRFGKMYEPNIICYEPKVKKIKVDLNDEN